ncbi:MAG: ABC transporter permease, partial [Myxococcales bacterium]|nr:ABC transporter permease [Myxococcales bacterium]
LQNGRMSYLVHPERLLDLPPDERETVLPLTLFEEPLEAPPEAPSPPPDAGAPEGGLGASAPAASDALEEFLLETERGTPSARERDVLPGIIVGRELAQTLRLYLGDEVDVVSPLGELGPTGPIPKSRPFRVAGIFYSGMYEYDMKYAYTLLPTAQSFLNAGDGVSGIEIRVQDLDRAPAVAAAIRERLGANELRVEDWQERNRELFGALQLEKLVMFVLLGIAIVIAGFCVFGTLTLMVQEKQKEVGVLKAMGATTSAILRIFIIDGLLIGLLGAGAGLGMGFLAAFGAERFGIRLNPEIYYIDRLPVHVDGTEFTLVGVAAVLVCLLATLFPAYLASRLRPIDALRYE